MKYCFFLVYLLFSFSLQAQTQTIIIWHALAGHLGQEFRNISKAFNQSQSNYEIKTIYKGDYVETLTSYAAAFRAAKAPDMVQIMEVGTATMLRPKGVIKPVEQLFNEQKLYLPSTDLIPLVRSFYSVDGKLMAFPLSNSVPVMYYNKEALKKIGYEEKDFPKDWEGLEHLLKTLNEAGFSCGYTSAYPAWILVESFMALHGLSAYDPATQTATYDQPALVAHFKRLKRWQQLGYFRYGGRSDNATSLFTSGLCPLYSQSSGAYNSLKAIAPFALGISALPIDKQMSQQRHANVVGGAALWVSAGRNAAQEKGIAQFLAFISQTEIQKKWHENSGYLPLGFVGQYATISKNSHHPVISIAEKDLQETGPAITMNNQVPQHQVRAVFEAAMEAMFSDMLSPESALKQAGSKANHLIRRYQRNSQ